MLSAGLTYGVLCIGVAGLASLMGGILQVEQLWRVENMLVLLSFIGLINSLAQT